MAQTNEVIEQLKCIMPNLTFKVIQIRTKGDETREFEKNLVDGKSLFTQEIEDALVQDQIDIAVHSMKDLTTDPSPRIVIAGVPKRANAHDVLVSRDKRKFSQLAPESRIGTTSLRRKSQLLAARGDLQVVDVRGNVDTRLRKLASGEFEALVLAAAGLDRLHLDQHVAEVLSTKIMLPAVGQGALAIQTRKDNQEIKDLIVRIDHPSSRREIEAERAFARKLGANCRTPIAAYARSDSSKLTIEGMVASPSGRILVRGRIVSSDPDSSKVGEELAQSLLDQGAEAVLEAS